MRQQWDLVCSRFFLTPQQGGLLLDMADQQALQRAARKPCTTSAAPALSGLPAGVLTAGALHFTHG
jgi:hypothetical protein